jgi:hypothetical protein
MYHPIVKERAPLSRRKAYRQSEIIKRTGRSVKENRRAFHRVEDALGWAARRRRRRAAAGTRLHSLLMQKELELG